MSVTLRKRKLPSGTVQIMLDVYLKGKRNFEALGMYLTGERARDKEIWATAEAIRAKREIELHNEKEGFKSQHKNKASFFAYALSAFEQKTVQTQRNYINMLEYLKGFVGSDLTFEKITPKVCEGFRTYLLSGAGNKDLRGLKKRNSAATYFERFRTILRQAVDDGIIAQNPSKGIFISTEETLPKYLTVEQLSILAKTPCGNDEVRDAFFFACYTGLRYGDASTLTWGQIHDDGIHLVQRKTKGGQVIPLHEAAKMILKRRKSKNSNSHDLVFNFPRRSTVDKVLKHWAKRAGLDVPLSYHKARHTMGTLMMTETGDIYTTSKALGHKNLATTLIYAKVVDAKKKAAVEKLPFIDGL